MFSSPGARDWRSSSDDWAGIQQTYQGIVRWLSDEVLRAQEDRDAWREACPCRWTSEGSPLTLAVEAPQLEQARGLAHYPGLDIGQVWGGNSKRVCHSLRTRTLAISQKQQHPDWEFYRWP